jgi:hypothetical protein
MMVMQFAIKEDSTTIEGITPEILKKAFQCGQQMKALPEELSNLHLLAVVANLPQTAKSIFFYDLVFDLVLDRLELFRKGVQIPYEGGGSLSLQAIRVQVAYDFSISSWNVSPDLMSWSALFHRHLVLMKLSARELAKVAGISDRQMRRYVQRGFMHLAQELCRVEMKAYL